MERRSLDDVDTDEDVHRVVGRELGEERNWGYSFFDSGHPDEALEPADAALQLLIKEAKGQ